MPRICTTLITALLLIPASTGCVSQRRASTPVAATAVPSAEAPQIDLGQKATPAVSTVSHQLEPKIRIVDVRPPEEQQYYPGETDPHCWRDAMTVLPLESFQPSFDKSIRQHVVRNLDDALQYSAIDLRVASFHVALDERHRGEEELLYDYKNWDDELERRQAEEAEKRRIKNEDKDMGEAMVDSIVRAVVVTPIKQRRLRKERKAQTAVAEQTLPVSLTKDKQPGWNCHLSVEVILEQEDGTSRTVPISADALIPKDDAVGVEPQIQQVVAAAMADFGLQLREAQLAVRD